MPSQLNGKEKVNMTSLVKCPMCSVSHLPLKGDLDRGTYACTCENCGHFFKFQAVGDLKASITLTINGQNYNIGNEYNPATSLLEFMRQAGISRGTKGCCFEGGCGVCLVTVKFVDPLTNKPRLYTINSCMLQLYTCDGLEVTTIEGLGDTRDGLHPVQERLAKFDGAQCGYCSPGQVMNMYGLLQNNPKPTMQQVEDSFDATICRCTGYRSILDAMKSFAVDAPPSLKKKGGVIDIEELDGKLCKKTGKACVGHCGGGHVRNGQTVSCENSVPRPLHIVYDQAQWFKPLTLAELTPLLKQYATQSYRLIFGNTGFGVFGEVGPWNFGILIDIRGVQDFYTVDLTPADHITFGANVSLTALKEVFETTTDPELPYAQAFATHLGRTASSSLRNLSSWAGNLAMKNAHNDFASDVYTILETVGTQVTIVDGDGVSKQYSLVDFLSVDLKGKVIVSMTLPKYNTSDVIVRTEKTAHRLQLCHAHVVSGFNFRVDASNNFLVKAKPSIVIQGINGQLVHAVQTEAFLVNKSLADPAVLQSALTVLSGEIVPDSATLLASPGYRKSLAIGQFYKFVLGVCKSKCSSRFASGGLDLVRPVMSGSQDLGTTDPSVYPATESMMKLTAHNLTTGEVKFVADLAPRQGQLYAAPVLSTQGNAKIQSIDASLALQIPGVVKFIQAKDMPAANLWRPRGLGAPDLTQNLLADGQVNYAGQPLGILIAEDEVTAQSSRYGVQVTYTDIKPALTDVEEAIRQKSFIGRTSANRGNATAAMAAAPHRVSGTVRCSDQYNFFLENQAALCVPTDTGGMDVVATTQHLDPVIQAVSTALGIKQSRVTVETQRIGGGFGGKTSYNAPVAGMCAVAAYLTKRPVLMNLDIHTNMQFQGKRTLFVFEYEVGFDDNGKLIAIIATTYADLGAQTRSFYDEHTTAFIDNVYTCPNWAYAVQLVRTNKPVSTAVRAPGTAPAIFGMECMIDHVATYLKKDHLAVRKANFIKDGDMTLGNMLIENCLISDLVAQLETDIGIANRVQAVNDFNKNNRWKKRGFHVMPNKYDMGWSGRIFSTSLYVNHGDGSVHLCHGGIDMGQGINTKAIQCVAYKLGIPIDLIHVKPTSTIVNTNADVTAGSTSTDIVCLSLLKCCEDLLQRMAPSRAKLANPTWQAVVNQSYRDLVDLRAYYQPQIRDKYSAHYVCWGACAVEVEIDVLTGHYQILQVDYLNDTGISLNPELDMGQLEGGFLMGCGLFLLENLKYDPVTGQLLNDGTWEYKPPLTKDLPIVFNAKFMRNVPNPAGVLGSKIVGEAPVSAGAAVLFALKRAVEAARAEQNNTDWFPFHAPATVESIQTNCLNNVSQFTFGS